MSEVKLLLENIGVFRGRREFKLSKGLNILYAPNASGKTSLLAGLKAASISALTTDELSRILNDYEDRGRIKLVFDDKEYVVELIRRPDGKVEAWGRRLADNGVIKDIAFIDLENRLVNAVYAGDSERVRDILRDITGITFIETIIEVIDGLHSETQYKYEMEKKAYEAKKEEVERRIKELEKRLKKVRERLEEIRSDPTLEPARKEIEKIEKERKKYKEELDDVRRKELEKRNEYGLLDRDLRNLEAELRVYMKRREELMKEKRKLEKNLISIRKEIETLREKVKELKDRIDSINSDIREKKDLVKRRRDVLEYAQCPWCGCSIDKDRLHREIMELEEEIEKLKEEMIKLNETKSEYEIKIAELEEKGELRLKSIEKELDELNKKIKNVEEQYSSVRRTIGELKKLLKKLEEQRKYLELQIEIQEAKLEKFKDKIPLVSELRRLWEEERRLSSDRENEYARLRQIENLYREVKELEEMIRTLELLKEYFRIRLNELKSTVVDRINEAVLRHFKLLRLAELEYPILSQDFELTLARIGGIRTALAELSDAEKAILVILITLALKDYVAEDFPFYVVDTLVEFIDDTRAREILKYLMEVAGKNKVLIVTKTKPYTGEPKLLTQEDIVVNKVEI